MHLPRNLVLITLALCLAALLAPAVARGQAATAANNPADLYKRAVALVDEAERRLAAGEPEQALARAKEARAFLTALQKEHAEALSHNKLSPAQEEQEDRNSKLADEHFALGQQFEKSADANMAKSKQLQQEGKKAEARQAEADARQDYELSLTNYVKSQIFSLRNQELVLGFLKK